MILYHYTALMLLSKILSEGLTKGEVWRKGITLDRPQKIDNGVWFTTESTFKDGRHSIPSERILTPAECVYMRVPKGAKIPNKRAVRITVDIPETSVVNWFIWSLKTTATNVRRALIRTGGGEGAAKTWYISFDPIKPEQFTSIDYLQKDGSYAETPPA